MPHCIKSGGKFARLSTIPSNKSCSMPNQRRVYHLIIYNFRRINRSITNIRTTYISVAFWEDPMTISRRQFVGSVAGAGIASLAAPNITLKNPVYSRDYPPAKNLEQ
jgi:hypothetical protein